MATRLRYALASRHPVASLAATLVLAAVSSANDTTVFTNQSVTARPPCALDCTSAPFFAESIHVDMTPNGRYVAFAAKVGAYYQIFRHDRDPDMNSIMDEPCKQETIQVTRWASGGGDPATSAPGDRKQPRISDNGKRIVYTSHAAPQGFTTDTNGTATDIYYTDITPVLGAGGGPPLCEAYIFSTVHVSYNPSPLPNTPAFDPQGPWNSFQPSISGDGKRIAFLSQNYFGTLEDLPAQGFGSPYGGPYGNGISFWDAFMRDYSAPGAPLIVLSVGDVIPPASHASTNPSSSAASVISVELSRNGTVAVFHTASGIIAGGVPPYCPFPLTSCDHVYLRDIAAAATVRITTGVGVGQWPSITPVTGSPGAYTSGSVAYAAAPGEGVPGPIQVVDLVTMTITDTTVGDGTKPRIASNGNVVAFYNGGDQVVGFNRTLRSETLIDTGNGSSAIPPSALNFLPAPPGIRADGSEIALFSSSSDLSASDTNAVMDVFVARPWYRPGTFCDASDGALAVCPCDNPGFDSTGCDNAQGTGGVALNVVAQCMMTNQATIVGTGYPTGAMPLALLVRYTGSGFGTFNANADGVLCLPLSGLVRLDVVQAMGGVSTHWITHGAMAGSGQFYYQVNYTNTPSTYCDPLAGSNWSNGQTVIW